MDCLPELVPFDEYDYYSAKLRSCFSWIYSKAGQIENNNTSNDDCDVDYEYYVSCCEESFKMDTPPVNTYIKAIENLFGAYLSLAQGYKGVVQWVKEQGSHVDDVINKEDHMMLVDALMQMYVAYADVSRNVTSSGAPSMLQWLDCVAVQVLKENFIDTHKLTPSSINDLSEGKLMALCLCHHGLVAFGEICLETDLGIADSLYNLQLVHKAMWRAERKENNRNNGGGPLLNLTHLSITDLFYTHSLLNINMLVLLADLYRYLEKNNNSSNHKNNEKNNNDNNKNNNKNNNNNKNDNKNNNLKDDGGNNSNNKNRNNNTIKDGAGKSGKENIDDNNDNIKLEKKKKKKKNKKKKANIDLIKESIINNNNNNSENDGNNNGNNNNNNKTEINSSRSSIFSSPSNHLLSLRHAKEKKTSMEFLPIISSSYVLKSKECFKDFKEENNNKQNNNDNNNKQNNNDNNNKQNNNINTNENYLNSNEMNNDCCFFYNSFNESLLQDDPKNNNNDTKDNIKNTKNNINNNTNNTNKTEAVSSSSSSSRECITAYYGSAKCSRLPPKKNNNNNNYDLNNKNKNDKNIIRSNNYANKKICEILAFDDYLEQNVFLNKRKVENSTLYPYGDGDGVDAKNVEDKIVLDNKNFAEIKGDAKNSYTINQSIEDTVRSKKISGNFYKKFHIEQVPTKYKEDDDVCCDIEKLRAKNEGNTNGSNDKNDHNDGNSNENDERANVNYIELKLTPGGVKRFSKDGEEFVGDKNEKPTLMKKHFEKNSRSFLKNSSISAKDYNVLSKTCDNLQKNLSNLVKNSTTNHNHDSNNFNKNNIFNKLHKASTNHNIQNSSTFTKVNKKNLHVLSENMHKNPDSNRSKPTKTDKTTPRSRSTSITPTNMEVEVLDTEGLNRLAKKIGAMTHLYKRHHSLQYDLSKEEVSMLEVESLANEGERKFDGDVEEVPERNLRMKFRRNSNTMTWKDLKINNQSSLSLQAKPLSGTNLLDKFVDKSEFKSNEMQVEGHNFKNGGFDKNAKAGGLAKEMCIKYNNNKSSKKCDDTKDSKDDVKFEILKVDLKRKKKEILERKLSRKLEVYDGGAEMGRKAFFQSLIHPRTTSSANSKASSNQISQSTYRKEGKDHPQSASVFEDGRSGFKSFEKKTKDFMRAEGDVRGVTEVCCDDGQGGNSEKDFNDENEDLKKKFRITKNSIEIHNLPTFLKKDATNGCKETFDHNGDDRAEQRIMNINEVDYGRESPPFGKEFYAIEDHYDRDAIADCYHRNSPLTVEDSTRKTPHCFQEDGGKQPEVENGRYTRRYRNSFSIDGKDKMPVGSEREVVECSEDLVDHSEFVWNMKDRHKNTFDKNLSSYQKYPESSTTDEDKSNAYEHRVDLKGFAGDHEAKMPESFQPLMKQPLKFKKSQKAFHSPQFSTSVSSTLVTSPRKSPLKSQPHILKTISKKAPSPLNTTTLNTKNKVYTKKFSSQENIFSQKNNQQSKKSMEEEGLSDYQQKLDPESILCHQQLLDLLQQEQHNHQQLKKFLESHKRTQKIDSNHYKEFEEAEKINSKQNESKSFWLPIENEEHSGTGLCNTLGEFNNAVYYPPQNQVIINSLQQPYAHFSSFNHQNSQNFVSGPRYNEVNDPRESFHHPEHFQSQHYQHHSGQFQQQSQQQQYQQMHLQTQQFQQPHLQQQLQQNILQQYNLQRQYQESNREITNQQDFYHYPYDQNQYTYYHQSYHNEPQHSNHQYFNNLLATNCQESFVENSEFYKNMMMLATKQQDYNSRDCDWIEDYPKHHKSETNTGKAQEEMLQQQNEEQLSFDQIQLQHSTFEAPASLQEAKEKLLQDSKELSSRVDLTAISKNKDSLSVLEPLSLFSKSSKEVVQTKSSPSCAIFTFKMNSFNSENIRNNEAKRASVPEVVVGNQEESEVMTTNTTTNNNITPKKNEGFYLQFDDASAQKPKNFKKHFTNKKKEKIEAKSEERVSKGEVENENKHEDGDKQRDEDKQTKKNIEINTEPKSPVESPVAFQIKVIDDLVPATDSNKKKQRIEEMRRKRLQEMEEKKREIEEKNTLKRELKRIEEETIQNRKKDEKERRQMILNEHKRKKLEAKGEKFNENKEAKNGAQTPPTNNGKDGRKLSASKITKNNNNKSNKQKNSVNANESKNDAESEKVKNGPTCLETMNKESNENLKFDLNFKKDSKNKNGKDNMAECRKGVYLGEVGDGGIYTEPNSLTRRIERKDDDDEGDECAKKKVNYNNNKNIKINKINNKENLKFDKSSLTLEDVSSDIHTSHIPKFVKNNQFKSKNRNHLNDEEDVDIDDGNYKTRLAETYIENWEIKYEDDEDYDFDAKKMIIKNNALNKYEIKSEHNVQNVSSLTSRVSDENIQIDLPEFVEVKNPSLYTGPKLYVKPSQKSNRSIIENSLNHCCLAGTVNAEQKIKVLEILNKSECKHFLVLFRNVALQYRGLYTYDTDTEQALKIHGVGPKVVGNQHIEKFYKYNSGAKNFSVVSSTKHLSSTIDAISLFGAVWSKNKTGKK